MNITTPEQIVEIVDRIEDKQQEWKTAADESEEMWALELWDNESDETRTYVTSASPHNAVNTARRMLNTVDVNVRCPAVYASAQSDLAMDMKERWLKAMWDQVRIDRKENVIGSAFWQALVLGKGVMQALWIKDVLPANRADRQMPFLVRTLDPRMCGFEEGPLYMQYAFYKPEMSVMAIRQQFPDYDNEDEDEDTEKEVIDFWWVEASDGAVYNAVIVDEEFVMLPSKTEYIDIPLVPFSGFYQPSKEERHRHMSFLFPLRNGWEVTSDILTMTATALIYHYLPPTLIVNEFGEAANDEPLAPGEVRQFPAGTSFPNIFNSPNQGLANSLLASITDEVRESTFTGAANGQPLGSNQAGYSYSAAMAADESRIQEPRTNLEVAVATINEIVMGFVDAFAGEEGIVVQGDSAVEGGRFIVRLTPEMVNGNYRNEVRLKPTTERDTAAMVALGQRLVDGATISRETMRDIFIPYDLPTNEQQRIQLEQAMSNPSTAPIVALHTLQSYGSDSPAVQQLVQVLQAQVQAIMAQLQQAQQPQPQAGAATAAPSGQPPSMSAGMLSPQAEGQTTQSTFAQGNGEQIPPELLREIMGGSNNG